MNIDRTTKTRLQPDRPGPLTVFWIRMKGVLGLILRGRFRNLVGHVSYFLYRRRYPDHPWLAIPANSILWSLLSKNDVGLEFGSGKSTVWFAKKISRLISIEHDSIWHDKVTKQLALQGLLNVDCLLIKKMSWTKKARTRLMLGQRKGSPRTALISY
jgi:hypothetical protein